MLKKTLAITGLTLSLSANAAIIDNGTYTTDTVTGLNWLDVTTTQGLSINYVEGTLLSEGGAYSNYRYATQSELEQLVWHYGVSSDEGDLCTFNPDGCDKFSDSSLPRLTTLVLDLGDTYTAHDPTHPDGIINIAQGTSGFVSTLTADGLYRKGLSVHSVEKIRVSNGLRTYSPGLQHRINMSEKALDYELGQWGHYLVTDSVTPVPLPAAAWLFGSALLGLGAIKRRKA